MIFESFQSSAPIILLNNSFLSSKCFQHILVIDTGITLMIMMDF